MRWNNAWIVMHKDLDEFKKQKLVIGSIIAMPIILGVILPLVLFVPIVTMVPLERPWDIDGLLEIGTLSDDARAPWANQTMENTSFNSVVINHKILKNTHLNNCIVLDCILDNTTVVDSTIQNSSLSSSFLNNVTHPCYIISSSIYKNKTIVYQSGSSNDVKHGTYDFYYCTSNTSNNNCDL
jgi:hypothetical protein